MPTETKQYYEKQLGLYIKQIERLENEWEILFNELRVLTNPAGGESRGALYTCIQSLRLMNLDRKIEKIEKKRSEITNKLLDVIDFV